MRFKLIALVGILFITNSCSDYANDPIPTPGHGAKPESTSGAFHRPLSDEHKIQNQGEFTVEKMLVNIGINVIAKNIDDFYFKSGLLKMSVANYCTEMKNSDGTDDFDKIENNVKTNWKETMLAFHKVSMSGVGILTDNNGALYNKIYSWPVVSQCGIDQEVIKNQSPALAEDVLANRRSLSALEYLLFEPTLISKCAPFVEPKAKEWSAKSTFEKKRDRCVYAQKIADDIQKNAEVLRTVWDVDKENYTMALIDGSVYQSQLLAVNALTDALFSIEYFRDTDLAIPLGIHASCKNPSGKCIESLEHPWSGIAAEAAIAQIEGFKEAFFGSRYNKNAAFGLDDFLISKGHPEVAETIKTSINASLTGMRVLAKQDPALQTTILAVKKENCNIFESPQESLDFICQIYKDIQTATSTLKTDVMILLALQVPTSHAGDND